MGSIEALGLKEPGVSSRNVVTDEVKETEDSGYRAAPVELLQGCVCSSKGRKRRRQSSEQTLVGSAWF